MKHSILATSQEVFEQERRERKPLSNASGLWAVAVGQLLVCRTGKLEGS